MFPDRKYSFDEEKTQSKAVTTRSLSLSVIALSAWLKQCPDTVGDAENAGLENAGLELNGSSSKTGKCRTGIKQIKSQDWKMQDWN